MRRFLGAALAALAVFMARPALGQEPAPKTDAERLADLEKKLADQQKEIDALQKDKAAKKPEEKPGEKPATEDKREDKTEIGWKDGFFIKGKLGGSDYEIRPRARIQLDYRAFPHAAVNDAFNQPVKQDQFLIRRARVGFGGKFNVFTFELDVDPTRNVPTGLPLGDFWFQWNVQDEFKIRFGHYKCPFDLEDFATSDLYLPCVERPMITGSGNQLAPDYLPGVHVTGQVNKMVTYWLGVSNQTDSNAFGTAGTPGAGAAGKAPTNPPPASNISGDPLTSTRIELTIPDSGFYVGGGAIWANRAGLQNGFAMTTPGQFTWMSPIFVRGWDQRYEFDVAFYKGPFFIQGVFAYASQERWRVLDDHSNGTGLVTQGWAITAGFMFAGPPKGVTHPVSEPFKDWQVGSFDIERKKSARNVGAELIVRIEEAQQDDTHGGRRGQGAVPAQPQTRGGADIVRGNDCRAVTFGLNLYPIENVKFMADYVYLRIGDQNRSEKPHDRFANEFLFRAQLEF
ncbi:hypothetical protein HY251_05315 [bacterium]|nr:hypothetical protein [bacterium]